MKTTLRHFLPVGLVLAAGSVLGQSVPTDPNLGYLYPAGGKAGRTVEVLAGGQRLNGVKSAIVTGEGVEVARDRSGYPGARGEPFRRRRHVGRAYEEAGE